MKQNNGSPIGCSYWPRSQARYRLPPISGQGLRTQRDRQVPTWGIWRPSFQNSHNHSSSSHLMIPQMNKSPSTFTPAAR